MKKITISNEDRTNLLERKSAADSLEDTDFSGLVVNKPWGYEYLLYENKNIAIWMLYLKKGHSTSMHCHPKKKTSLIILSGEAITSTLNEKFKLKDKEGLIIDKSVFHKTEAVSENGIFLIEVETPPDKTDLFRLVDKYKREKQGYTHKKNITDKTYNYHYLFMQDKENSNDIFGKYRFLIRSFKDDEFFQENLKDIDAELGIVIDGEVFSDGEKFIVGESFENNKKLKISSQTKILFISERKKLIKTSDYIASFLKKNNIDNAFLMSGGKIMYLLDSIRKSGINYICNYHEQASTMAAESYAKLKNNIGLAIVSGGSAASNAITGVAGAWIDSTPLLVISGQSYKDQTIENSGLRQLGVHELNIVDIVRPITKYAVTVKDARKIRYHLEKAIYMAKSGRPGPVWIDIPIDIQMSLIEEEKLDKFNIPELKENKIDEKVSEVIKLIDNSQRPIILIGNGVRYSNSENEFIELIKKLDIPVLTSANAGDLIDDSNSLYAGRPGMFGQRAANFAVQNSDLLLCIGSRVGYSLTGWANKDFARSAKKVMINIDENELEKGNVKFDLKIKCDAGDFIKEILKQFEKGKDYVTWKNKINYWKNKYPNIFPVKEENSSVNPYNFVDLLSTSLTEEDVLVSDSAMSLQCIIQAMKFKKGQRFISSFGLGSVGFGLPGAIGACVANGRKRTICVSGDGGLQFNIQELQTVKHNNLPIKLFVFNNNNYALMKGLQERYFDGNIGVDKNSGISMPDIEKIAFSYGIKFERIAENKEIKDKLTQVLNYDGPVICCVDISENQQVIPRQGSFDRPDGKTVPRPIEDMFPYLDREELEEEMIIPPIYFDPYREV